MFDEDEDIRSRVEALYLMLISRATGGSQDGMEYRRLRDSVLSEPLAGAVAPSFLRSCRDLGMFWAFIKEKSDSYRGRREFLAKEFEPMRAAVDPVNHGPYANLVELSLLRLDSASVQREWTKALLRQDVDPDGAITIARTLVETVCKHILQDLELEVDERADLPKLYGTVSENLKLSPSQYSERAFKAILGGCSSVASGLAELRNKLGDAHGKPAGVVRARPRHARLAVSVAGAMAMFLVETWEARKEDGERSR